MDYVTDKHGQELESISRIRRRKDSVKFLVGYNLHNITQKENLYAN
jgi:hypothetical protein